MRTLTTQLCAVACASVVLLAPAHALADGGTRAATITTLSSTHDPSTPGQSVGFVATVVVAAGTPTGLVTFKDGAQTLGGQPLDATGKAQLNTSTLGIGDHAITATYAGDANYYTSVSSTITQTVAEPPVDAGPADAGNGGGEDASVAQDAGEGADAGEIADAGADAGLPKDDGVTTDDGCGAAHGSPRSSLAIATIVAAMLAFSRMRPMRKRMRKKR